MEWWAIVGVVVMGIISAVALILAFLIFTEDDDPSGVAIALGVFVVFGMLIWPFVEFGQASPADPPPARGYVIGLEVNPAHTDESCVLVGKVVVCDDEYVGEGYRIKVEAPDGDVGWRDVTGRVFRECDIGSFYERGRCQEVGSR